jgi:MBG domain (YGX type)
VSLSTTADAASPVGPHPITAAGASDANYTVTFAAGTLTVTPAALLVTAENKSRVYGAANPPLTAAFAGFVNGDTEASLDTPVSLSTTADAASPVGPHPITAAGASDANYTVTFAAGTLTVTPAGPLTLTIVSADTIGNATMRITSDAGQRITVQASTNLTTWLDIVTLTNTTGTIDHTDPTIVGRPHRFYRAVLTPE